jgi:hypothetical protein
MAENRRDPELLTMQASKQRGADPYFRLHVEYELVRTVPEMAPARDLVEAALRMLAVQKGAGIDLNLVERLIAETGLATLPWIDSPDNGPPQAQPGGSSPHGSLDGAAIISAGAFEPNHDFDGFIVELSARERASFEASIAMLLGAVVFADGEFDRLERIEIDWTMNIEVPSALGDAFRVSDAAAHEYEVLCNRTVPVDRRSLDARLVELAAIVGRLPAPLRERYTSFVIKVCRAAAEASGGWLWFGTKVGAEEKQVLDQIAASLGLREP